MKTLYVKKKPNRFMSKGRTKMVIPALTIYGYSRSSKDLREKREQTQKNLNEARKLISKEIGINHY